MVRGDGRADQGREIDPRDTLWLTREPITGELAEPDCEDGGEAEEGSASDSSGASGAEKEVDTTHHRVRANSLKKETPPSDKQGSSWRKVSDAAPCRVRA